jgi:hypothetical protein
MCTAALVAPAANAAEFNGKSNLVCAATDVVACSDDLGCMEGQARTFDLPDFMYVDFKKKIVHARSADATLRVESPFPGVVVGERSLVLQGVENDQGWTLSVNRVSGRMTTTVSGGAAHYMIFGVCTAI